MCRFIRSTVTVSWLKRSHVKWWTSKKNWKNQNIVALFCSCFSLLFFQKFKALLVVRQDQDQVLQVTPASSTWPQLVFPQPENLHWWMVSSAPVHATSSIQIRPVPAAGGRRRAVVTQGQVCSIDCYSHVFVHSFSVCFSTSFPAFFMHKQVRKFTVWDKKLLRSRGVAHVQTGELNPS